MQWIDMPRQVKEKKTETQNARSDNITKFV